MYDSSTDRNPNEWKFLKRIVLLLPLLLITIHIFSTTVSAQTPQQPIPLDVTVSPPLLDITALPGEKVEKTIRVRNNSDTPINLTITTKKLSSSSIDGRPVPADPGPNDTDISWVSFDQPTFTAPPKEWKDIKVTITVPPTAAFGYYYVFSLSENYPAEAVKAGTVAIHSQVLIVTFLNVKKDGAKVAANLVHFTPTHFISQFLPITFTTVVQNVGNIHIRPRGNIFIRGHGQTDIDVLEVNQNEGAILPSGKRTFTSDWNDGFIVNQPEMLDDKPKLDQKGNPITHLTINWNKITSFRFGHYTASEVLIYDDGTRDQTLEGTTSFWIIPYIPLASILCVLIVLFIIIRLLFKMSVNRALKNTRR